MVELPHDDPAAFNAYLHWLHSRDVALGYNDGEDPRTDCNFTRLTPAYVLGDTLLDSDFKDDVTDAMVQSIYTRERDGDKFMIPDHKLRLALYNVTVAGCTARRLLVHRMARFKQPELLHEDDIGAFILDMAKEALVMDDVSTLDAAARCAFHEHATGVENCYRTKYA